MVTNDPARPLPAANDRVNLAEASRLARRDRKTLMKDVEEGRLPHATREPSGRRGHLLLVQDLVEAGFVRPDQVAPARLQPLTADTSVHLRIIELEAQLRAQEAVAEGLRAEVTRLHELAMALILGTGPGPNTAASD